MGTSIEDSGSLIIDALICIVQIYILEAQSWKQVLSISGTG